MRVNDQEVTFNVLDTMEYKDDVEECAIIGIENGISCYELDDLFIAGREAKWEKAKKKVSKGQPLWGIAEVKLFNLGDYNHLDVEEISTNQRPSPF